MHDRRPSIELLSSAVVEKIAAGEVIERPASVVKELIENAIDAGATTIGVSVEEAGFSSICVRDNGCGMAAPDLDKCLLRNATSKIRTADDLYAVSTLGFRGEALASIAAVSRLTVTTAADESGLGNRIENAGGVRTPLQPAAHLRGTTIEARDLFFNVPARKKFMKSQRSEQAAVSRVVEQVALAFPSIHFTLDIDDKRALELPVVDTPLARIAAVAGNAFARGLIECTGSRTGVEVVVYVSSPEVLQAKARYQSLYVNLRRVDSDAITYAICEAFAQFLGAHYRPSFFCFLTVDPSRIDVNVHPAKQLVKFDDERSLAGFIYATVKTGIGAKMAAQGEIIDKSNTAVPDAAEVTQESLHLTRNSGTPRSESTIPFPVMPKVNEYGDADDLRRRQPEGETVWDLISCYQIHETYILAPIKNGILLIDQHAAHERILFEQAQEDIGRGRSASQQLLFPVVIELSSVEKAVVMSGQQFFSTFGFELSDFGGTAVSLSAIPFFMRTADVEAAVRLMVGYLLDEKERDALNDTGRRFAAAFACGAAIKAGQKLTQEEMNALVNSLFATKNPYTCPHGRPTLVRISLDELSRRFLRSGG